MNRRQPESDFTQDPDEPAALRLVALPPIYAEDHPKGTRPSAHPGALPGLWCGGHHREARQWDAGAG